MEMKRKAMAGSLESSDILVEVTPGGSGVEIELESTVLHQYGDAIRASILETAGELGVGAASIRANDHGALDCTVRARTETALRRAGEEERA